MTELTSHVDLDQDDTIVKALRDLTRLAAEGIEPSGTWSAAVGRFRVCVHKNRIAIYAGVGRGDDDLVWQWSFAGHDERMRDAIVEHAVGAARIAHQLLSAPRASRRVTFSGVNVWLGEPEGQVPQGTRWDVRLGSLPIDVGRTYHTRHEVAAMAAALSGYAFAKNQDAPSWLMMRDALAKLGPVGEDFVRVPWEPFNLYVKHVGVTVRVTKNAAPLPAHARATFEGSHRWDIDMPVPDKRELDDFVRQVQALPDKARREAAARWNPEGDLLE